LGLTQATIVKRRQWVATITGGNAQSTPNDVMASQTHHKPLPARSTAAAANVASHERERRSINQFDAPANRGRRGEDGRADAR
jgi:hypothetical protein